MTVKLGGLITFHWVFEGERLAPSYLRYHLTVPSLRRRAALAAENRRLRALLVAKDAEIEDMKLGGAKVSRKMLETKRFEEVADSDDEPSEEWLRGVEMEGDGSLGKTQETTSPASNSSSANSTLAKNSESTDPIPRKRSASPTSEAPFTALLSQPPGAKEKAVKLRKKKLGL